MPIIPALGLIFVTLKILGYIAWSWWWVTMPFWIVIPIFAVIGIFALVSAASGPKY